MFFLILLCIVGLIPAAFSACNVNSLWCSIAYWATESAGKIGTMVILTFACIFYTIRIESTRKKLKVFLKSFTVLGLLLAGVAYLNEHFTKEMIAIPRPSHLYIVNHSKPLVPIDSIYKITEEKRRLLLQNLIQSDTLFNSIDHKVQKHWIEEAGYSFPSGHSFNSFLLALILSYSLYHSRKKWITKLYLFPFAWALLVAISRVAIGAHSALDVSFGAGLGLVVGNLFLYIDYTRAVITERS